MLRLWHQPYPFENSARHTWRISLLFGVFIGLFLWVFQPFGLSEWHTDAKSLKLLGFGLVSFGIMELGGRLWPALWPTFFREERWTVGREIGFLLWTLALISVGNWLYWQWITDDTYANLSLLKMVAYTLLIGVFPVVGLVLYKYIRQLKKYSTSATEMTAHTHGQDLAESDTVLTLLADNEKDRLTLRSSALLYVESSDNYCTVVYRTDDGPLQKRLLRSSLTRIETQINRPHHIVRCHRSYVVNLDNVVRVTGNAQGYRLHVPGSDAAVPVARQYNDTLVRELKGL